MAGDSLGYERYVGVFTPSASTTSYIVSPGFETQTLIDSITAFPLVEIGSNKFMEAYCINLERLSIQAHLTAGEISSREAHDVKLSSGLFDAGSQGEYIVESFWERPEKIGDMTKTLLALEFWRQEILFREYDDKRQDEYEELNNVDGGEDEDVLAPRLASNKNGLRTAFILHTETTIVSLLNLIFYKGIPTELLEGNRDEVLLSLVDFCARQLVFLSTPQETNKAIYKQKNPKPTSELADYLANRTHLEEIQDSVYKSTYQTAVAAVALSRYICENINDLGQSIVSRIFTVHDFPLLMVPLIEESPWTRRRVVKKDGNASTVWEKLNEHNEWMVSEPADLLRLTKLEGQPWLALYHLTASKAGREAYELDEFRKTNLMRLRKYLNKALLDQVPVLEDLVRYLDELSIMDVSASGPSAHNPSSPSFPSGLLMQRVDSLRESIVGKKQLNKATFCNEIIEAQWKTNFSSITDSNDQLLRRIGNEIYGGSGPESIIETALVSNSVSKDSEKGVLAMPVEKVLLHIESETDIAEFELVPSEGDNGSKTDTPLGAFRRLKLDVHLMTGETEAICPHGKVVANILFVNTAGKKVSLSLDSLDLPTSQPNITSNDYEELGITVPPSFTSKEWRQLGDLHEKSVILQLGFRRLDCASIPAGCTYLRAYKLANAFISHPIAK